MGTQSGTTPGLADSKSPNEDGSSESVKPMTGNEQTANIEAEKEASLKSSFVNTEPMREEQVQNAVKFLSHPKVRGSPVIYRRSFLERKGLTKEEIDEAFRRVPDPPPNATSTPVAKSNQDDQLKPSPITQPQSSTQPSPNVVAPSSTSIVPHVKQSRFQWSHALLAIGVLAASGYGTATLVKAMAVPRFKSWIRSVVLEEDYPEKKESSKPTLAEEAAAAAKAAAAAAAKAAAAAAADVAKASQDMLNSKNEERKFFEACMALFDRQMQEMKSMGNAIRNLDAAREGSAPSFRKPSGEVVQSQTTIGTNDDSWRSVISQQTKVNGTIDAHAQSERPSSAPGSMDQAGQYPRSYMEIMAMLERGEKPPGIREIDDRPLNPNQPPTNPRMAPRTKPWEMSQFEPNFCNGSASEIKSGGSNLETQDNGGYMQNGKSAILSAESSEPWWRRKTVKTSEMHPESEDEVPVRRPWVPPQPPGVLIPEAAAAIRQAKSAPRKELSTDEDYATQTKPLLEQPMANGEGKTDEAHLTEGPETTTAGTRDLAVAETTQHVGQTTEVAVEGD